MTEFRTAAELVPRDVSRRTGNYARMWAMEEDFIRDLAANEGKYARYPKSFASYESADMFARTVTNRRRHSFRPEVCGFPGSFKTIITKDGDEYHVWVAYETNTGEEASDA
ncbi:hypothetical protein [Bifidobacterium choerinum]|uniref:Uncharacterized protein n=1 Tax=Bifidobacterium choerinum TaxID=35760 RepID=A0A087AFB6_9BIFI|nr:hypothetical protein [Bifidobacterium choerinum]KFI57466.1 hypothetical protein BCHO_0885 [Bifidobacterium choerinum]